MGWEIGITLLGLFLPFGCDTIPVTHLAENGRCCGFLSDANTLILLKNEQCVERFKVSSPGVRKSRKLPVDRVELAQMRGQTLVFFSRKDELCEFDTDAMAAQRTYHLPEHFIVFGVHPDRPFLFIGREDGKIAQYDARSCENVSTFDRGFEDDIHTHQIETTRDAAFLIAGYGPVRHHGRPRIVVWDMKTGQRIWALTDLEYWRSYSPFAVSTASDAVYFVDKGGSLSRLDLQTLTTQPFLKDTNIFCRELIYATDDVILIRSDDAMYIATKRGVCCLHRFSNEVACSHISVDPTGRRCCISSFLAEGQKTLMDIYDLDGVDR
jgi:hypothetical protein